MARLRHTLTVAMAFVGVIVGAGFASGQEILQYFVAFGLSGVWGALLSGVMMALVAFIIMQLSSYWLAQEHGEVLRKVAHPVVSRLLDIGVVITLFSTGFVMFAGAGSNLQQQWGLPLWVGAALMLLLTLGAGFLDVDKVTTIIGAITPFIIVFTLVAAVYTLLTFDVNVAHVDAVAQETLNSTLPSWWLAGINYTSFNIIVAVSMAIVIGGQMFNPRWAGQGGFLGGLIYAAMVLIMTLTLFASVEAVGRDDMPMLSIINQLHPWLGQLMAVAIFGMIFNTALGMFYALGKRLTAGHPERFTLVYTATVAVGFVLSFIGFQTLVAYVYPVLGYIGVLLIIVMILAWLRYRGCLAEEIQRRTIIENDEPGAAQAKQDSNLDEEQIAQHVEE